MEYVNEYTMEYVYNEYLKRRELFKNNIELTNPNQKLMEMHFKATIELIDAFRTYDEVNHSLIRKMAKNPFIMSYILLCNDTGVRLNENVIVLEDIIKDSIDGIDTFFMELKLFFIPKFLETRGQMTLSFMNVFCETAVKMSIGSYGLNCYFSGDTIDTNEDLILKFIPLLGNNIPFILGEKIIEELPDISLAKEDVDLNWEDYEEVSQFATNDLDDTTCYALLANILPGECVKEFFASTLLTIQEYKGKDVPEFKDFFNKFYEILNARNRERGDLSLEYYIDDDFKEELEYICMYIWFYSEESMLGIIFAMLVLLVSGVYDVYFFKESFGNLIEISSTTIRELNK